MNEPPVTEVLPDGTLMISCPFFALYTLKRFASRSITIKCYLASM